MSRGDGDIIGYCNSGSCINGYLITPASTGGKIVSDDNPPAIDDPQSGSIAQIDVIQFKRASIDGGFNCAKSIVGKRDVGIPGKIQGACSSYLQRSKLLGKLGVVCSGERMIHYNVYCAGYIGRICGRGAWILGRAIVGIDPSPYACRTPCSVGVGGEGLCTQVSV